MSFRDKSIRIVKREHRQPIADRRDIAHAKSKTENQTRRELIWTVTSWIDELRETKQEFLVIRSLQSSQIQVE